MIQVKKKVIKKDIKALINKYSLFLKSIETNLVEDELKKLNIFNDMMLEIKKELNNNSKSIMDFISDYKLEIISQYSYKDIITEICEYDLSNNEHILDEKEVIVFENILRNKNFPYNEFVNNLSALMVYNIYNLENKTKFLEDSNSLNDEIAQIINNYVFLVKELDKKVDMPSNKSVEEYNNLLDSVIADVKNKKAIF